MSRADGGRGYVDRLQTPETRPLPSGCEGRLVGRVTSRPARRGWQAGADHCGPPRPSTRLELGGSPTRTDASPFIFLLPRSTSPAASRLVNPANLHPFAGRSKDQQNCVSSYWPGFFQRRCRLCPLVAAKTANLVGFGLVADQAAKLAT
jgi:hypothetical protein